MSLHVVIICDCQDLTQKEALQIKLSTQPKFY